MLALICSLLVAAAPATDAPTQTAGAATSKQRPILGAAAALAGGFIFLRNPALATMVAAAFTEKSRGRRRR